MIILKFRLFKSLKVRLPFVESKVFVHNTYAVAYQMLQSREMDAKCGRSFGEDMKGKSLQTDKKTKSNKEKGFKPIGSLTFFVS